MHFLERNHQAHLTYDFPFQKQSLVYFQLMSVCVIMSEMVSRVLKPLLRAAQTQLSQ